MLEFGHGHFPLETIRRIRIWGRAAVGAVPDAAHRVSGAGQARPWRRSPKEEEPPVPRLTDVHHAHICTPHGTGSNEFESVYPQE